MCINGTEVQKDMPNLWSSMFIKLSSTPHSFFVFLIIILLLLPDQHNVKNHHIQFDKKYFSLSFKQGHTWEMMREKRKTSKEELR